jgi:hypothetical protein
MPVLVFLWKSASSKGFQAIRTAASSVKSSGNPKRSGQARKDVVVVINPDMLEGRLNGSIAQGIGQALSEEIVYDRESG